MRKFEIKDLMIDVTAVSRRGKAMKVGGILMCCDGPCTCYGNSCCCSNCSNPSVGTGCACFQDALGLKADEAQKLYARLERKLAEAMAVMGPVANRKGLGLAAHFRGPKRSASKRQVSRQASARKRS